MLKDREAAVLRTLVHNYIREGKPVGSRNLRQKYSFHLSSATIRNVMADLEINGYIAQPHSSAGRVPTDKGYRFYIDEVMRIYEAAYDEKGRLDDLYENRSMEIDGILSYSTHILAKISEQLGLILSPIANQLIIKKVELISLGEGEILALFITRSKVIINKRVQFQEAVSMEELHFINGLLNDILVGYGFSDIVERIEKQLNTLSQTGHLLQESANLQYKKIKDKMLHIANMVNSNTGLNTHIQEIFVDGIKNLVVHRDLFQPGNVEKILDLVEQKQQLTSLLRKHLTTDGVQTLLGQDLDMGDFNDCSIITSSYKMADKNVGIIGIIGPKRMAYDKIIPLVDEVSKVISALLEKMSK